jgi:hypothetical protein
VPLTNVSSVWHEIGGAYYGHWWMTESRGAGGGSEAGADGEADEPRVGKLGE